MRPVNVCTVVFNRYDLLRLLVESLRRSQVPPSALYVIDRGHNDAALDEALGPNVGSAPTFCVPLDGQNLAAAWNWFIQNVPEERIIASDDIVFFPETIGEFVTTPGDLIGIEADGSSHFACFLIRDSCVAKVGLFDEEISPDYLYFEDCDYAHRMALADVPLLGIRCLHHANSQSLKEKTPQQLAEHHRRFQIAQANFVRKWGRMPEPGKW